MRDFVEQLMLALFWLWYWYSCRRDKNGIFALRPPWIYIQLVLAIINSELVLQLSRLYGRPIQQASFIDAVFSGVFPKNLDLATIDWPCFAIISLLMVLIQRFMKADSSKTNWL